MEKYNFDNIPLWKGRQSNFEILSDKINGRIPVTRLESWRDFSELLEKKFFNRPNTQLIFRGHRRFDWALMPTLARISTSNIIDKELADSQLDHFRRAVRGRLADNSLVLDGEEDELWSVGQHHGLMTPLLDWTYSPYVALFFAFFKEDIEEESENPYRAIYVLNKTFVANDKLCPDIRMVEPKKDDHGRLVNQAGLFTFSPYESTIENKLIDTLTDDNFPDDELRNAKVSYNTKGEIKEEQQAGILAKYICKIYIKNEDREGCMRYLSRMNVHHASLFPDLIGASDYCNLLITQERRNHELQSSETHKENKLRSSIKNKINYVAPNKIGNLEALSFEKLLYKHAKKEVDSDRIKFLAESLSKELQPLMVVDWQRRESAKAKIRSTIRIHLRKYSYPDENSKNLIHALIEHLRAKSA